MAFVFACVLLLLGSVVFAVWSLFSAGEGVTRTVQERAVLEPDSVFEERTPQGGTEPRPAETAGSLTVYAASDGWQLIENNDLKFAVGLPAEWIIAKDTDTTTALKAFLRDASGMVQGALEISSEENAEGITPKEWAIKHMQTTDVQVVYAGGRQGARFESSLNLEYPDGDIIIKEYTRQTYALFAIDGTFIKVLCEATAKTPIQNNTTCDAVIKSFTFF